ncbi:MAG: polysaccharide biosynthesis/export family protein [Verrucomicrobiota bacterium]
MSTNAPSLVGGARLAPGDQIRVVFSGIAEPPQPHDEAIKEDGTITLPNIGVVTAEGKTTVELQKDIYEKYVPSFYKRLTVTVSTERRVCYVQGQVRLSGRQEYYGPTTVLKAIATAGDFTDFANRKRVVLTRADGTRIIVDCVKAARDSAYDLPVYPGDKIEVPMRGL